MIDQRLLKLNFKTFTSAIADLAMPRVCVVCGRALMPCEHHICIECLADLPLTRFATIPRNPMADLYNARIEESRGAAGISKTVAARSRMNGRGPAGRLGGMERSGSFVLPAAPRLPYQYATALFYYSSDSPYRKITQALKYHRDFGAGKMFARMLGEEMKGSAIFEDVDLVIPVPLHWTRKYKRGYNQADIIAKELAGTLCAKLDTKALKRTRRTGSQVRLTGEERERNVSGAFCVRSKENIARSRHILIVDDVYTTGATLAACADAVRAEVGPDIRISVATLGFVSSPTT